MDDLKEILGGMYTDIFCAIRPVVDKILCKFLEIVIASEKLRSNSSDKGNQDSSARIEPLSQPDSSDGKLEDRIIPLSQTVHEQIRLLQEVIKVDCEYSPNVLYIEFLQNLKNYLDRVVDVLPDTLPFQSAMDECIDCAELNTPRVCDSCKGKGVSSSEVVCKPFVEGEKVETFLKAADLNLVSLSEKDLGVANIIGKGESSSEVACNHIGGVVSNVSLTYEKGKGESSSEIVCKPFGEGEKVETFLKAADLNLVSLSEKDLGVAEVIGKGESSSEVACNPIGGAGSNVSLASEKGKGVANDIGKDVSSYRAPEIVAEEGSIFLDESKLSENQAVGLSGSKRYFPQIVDPESVKKTRVDETGKDLFFENSIFFRLG